MVTYAIFTSKTPGRKVRVSGHWNSRDGEKARTTRASFCSQGQVDAAQHPSCAAAVQDATLTVHRAQFDGSPPDVAAPAGSVRTAGPVAQSRFLALELDVCQTTARKIKVFCPAALLPLNTVARPFY